MKNFGKVFGIIVCAAIVGLGMMACSSGGDDGPQLPATDGLLTITGFHNSDNGKYAIAFGELPGESKNIGAMENFNSSKMTAKGGRISNNEVTMKVWAVDKTTSAAENYNGGHTVEFQIKIKSSSSFSEAAGDFDGPGAGYVEVAFTNGVGEKPITYHTPP